MKIILNSSSPETLSGYGIVCKELIRRLRNAGHFVRIATKHPSEHWRYYIDREQAGGHLRNARIWTEKRKWDDALIALDKAYEEVEGTEIYDGTYPVANDMLEEEDFDYIFTLWDIWQIKHKGLIVYPKDKWVAYVPIDTEWIADDLAEVCHKAGFHIAMSRHGERELRSIGINPFYAPPGIDTKAFRPDKEARDRFRKDFGWADENFIIGSVGLNYGDDRKGFIPLMQAFKNFHDRHKEAKLYLHTHASGKYPGTINYVRIAKKIGIDDDLIAWPHQPSNDIGRIDKEWLNDVYNGFDVFCLPSRGEGFGLPILESQACGVPIITTDTTTGDEFVGKPGTGWLIPARQDHLRYLPTNTFRYEVGMEGVLDCLESAYNAWKYSCLDQLKRRAREFAIGYDWDFIWKKYWRETFETLETIRICKGWF